MLLLAAKTSGVGHVVGENIEYFYEKTTDFVSADVIPLVHRLSFLCCASALPNPGFSKLLILEVIEHRNQYRCGYSMRCTNISAFANLNTAAWMLKERGVMGAPVTGKMRIRLQTKHCKIVDSSFVSFVLLILIFFTRWYHSDW